MAKISPITATFLCIFVCPFLTGSILHTFKFPTEICKIRVSFYRRAKFNISCVYTLYNKSQELPWTFDFPSEIYSESLFSVIVSLCSSKDTVWIIEEGKKKACEMVLEIFLWKEGQFKLKKKRQLVMYRRAEYLLFYIIALYSTSQGT